jgi:hypothetical protein
MQLVVRVGGAEGGGGVRRNVGPFFSEASYQ